MAPLAGIDQNSGRTRVTPVFTWLRDNGGDDWLTELLRLADGITVRSSVGSPISLEVGEEREVLPSPARLAWMISNAHRLAPEDGRHWREYQRRVIDHPRPCGDLTLESSTAFPGGWSSKGSLTRTA